MKSIGQIKIYIVEDNFMYSFVLEEMLKEHGVFKVTSFASAEECIEILDNNPDLIILDYNLEGMNGLDAFKIIHAKKPKIPVIILSGQSDVQVTADLLKMGAFDYIEKKDKEKTMTKIQNAVLNALK
jgi:DNA-binding NtrC family response regulator